MKNAYIVLAALLAGLASCQEGNKNKPDEVQLLRDSLENIIEQKNAEMDGLVATLNDIEEGFQEINQAEKRVQVARQGEGASQTARLEENVQFIQSTMKQNRELIAKLRQQLREGTIKSQQLKRAIDNLSAQLEEKSQMLAELREQLEQKDIHIAELDEQVGTLNQDVAELKDEQVRQQQTIARQDADLNSAWFVFGTKKELKAQRILDSGEVLRNNFNKDYFTKIDIRVDKEIKLYSSKAQILTAHPASSYTLEKDANKQYVLRISDPVLFWSTSKYLVVQVK
jgi:chromosome segregation ATPase